MNVWDIVILAVIAAAVGLAVRKIRKNKGGCSCGCSGCRKSEACENRAKPDKRPD